MSPVLLEAQDRMAMSLTENAPQGSVDVQAVKMTAGKIAPRITGPGIFSRRRLILGFVAVNVAIWCLLAWTLS